MLPDSKPTAVGSLCLPLLCLVNLTLQVMLCQRGCAAGDGCPKVSWPWVSHRRAPAAKSWLHITLCYVGQQGWKRWGHELSSLLLGSKLPACLPDPFAKSHRG